MGTYVRARLGPVIFYAAYSVRTPKTDGPKTDGPKTSWTHVTGSTFLQSFICHYDLSIQIESLQ